MKTVIIACRTLEKELLAAMANTGCSYPIRWLSAGDHNVPEKRRAQIQQALDACADRDTVLLAMSLCGGAAADLTTPGPRLVIPKCDDCITLLLGSPARRREFPAAYFLTEGWLSGRDNIRNEYHHALEKYGEAKAKRIFSAMLSNYRQLAFVDTGCGDASAEVQKTAALLELEYTRIPGTLSWLEDLLTGNRDSRFLVIPPKEHTVTVLPQQITVPAKHGSNLLDVLRQTHAMPEAPCGGRGTCGKCRVWVGGREVLACRTVVTRDLTVTVPNREDLHILHTGVTADTPMNPAKPGYLLAFDIGTTSVVCYLLDKHSGMELASAGAANPQAAYGADVISRIQFALDGAMEELTVSIRDCMAQLTETVCRQAGICPDSVGVVSVVGNPAMQQLFLGICPENLVKIPFSPVLTEAKTVPCGEYLPLCSEAELLIVPDISGYVGADTMGCILSAKMHESDEITLLVDIGTNGEMVLGNRDRLLACSTAAGPALEGANIRFGMRGTDGAIDHVWLEEDSVRYSVIGGGTAKGICGSGLIDAVAVMLQLGLLNSRGRIRTEDRCFHLTEDVYLTQEDIRQIQLAKGAIQAGIRLMAKQLKLELSQIRSVYLAGAFGAHLNPENACAVGLLPQELADRIRPVGNAAGSGAKMLARDASQLPLTQSIVEKCGFLELATLPDFPITFARSMGFNE